MRLAAAVREQMSAAAAEGHGEKDMAAVWHAVTSKG
jgi:hypothetical protein